MEDPTSPHMLSVIGVESFMSDGTLNVSAVSDGTSTSASKPQPNILKRRDFTLQGPIKNLPFSPSRFLNQKKLPDDLPVSCKIINAHEESLCTSHTEDSGIEISTCDIDSLFNNPITSTPKVKKLQSSISIDNSFEEVLRVSENSVFSGGDSVSENRKAASNSDKDVFRSPLIRRFINESGPRTPTPFKFRFGKNSFSRTVEECKDRSVAEPCNRISYRRWTYRSPSNTDCPYKRKARKALNMDSSCLNAKGECSDLMHKSMKSVHALPNQERFNKSAFYTSCINNESVTDLSMTSNSCKSLNHKVSGSGYSISVQNEYLSAQQSVIYPPSNKISSDVKYLSEMNEKLVRVACGLSEDQKAMTIAAKRCLKSLNGVRSSANDSSGIIPPSRRISHRMLC